MEAKFLLLTNAAATLFLVGLIWMVQVVHYPLFNMADRANFTAFEAAHSNRISVIVGPAMLLELVTAGWLLVSRPAGIPAWTVWLGAALVGVAWLVTAFLSVPQHAILSAGFNQTAYQTLVNTNWIRTVAWTARGALVLWMLSLTMR
jgi:hypothetical protein